jgi:phosphoserine aminotransferase
VVQLVMKWLEETMGGMEGIAAANRRKAELLYGYLDSQGFYQSPVGKDSQSFMNVIFRLPTPELEQQFIGSALAQDLGGLKGHRSVGGCRASLYNAVSLEAVQALVDFMKEFARKNG